MIPFDANLAEHMDDEVGHAKELTDRIFALKGKPTSKIEGFAEYTEDVDAALKQDIEAESKAIELYGKILDYAESVDDKATVMMIEAILDGERKHLDDFVKIVGR